MAHLLFTRFLHDTHAIGSVLNRLSADADEVEYADLVRRLTLIYDVLVPAAPAKD